MTYTYDSLNRLLTANGTGWGQQYGFDPFGNLLSKTVTAGSGPSLSQAVNPANNQIVGQSYDSNGNTVSVVNAGNTYSLSYDYENRLGLVSGGGAGYRYGYDAQNLRLWSWTNGTNDSYGNASNFAIMVYSPSGRRLGLYSFSTEYWTNQQTQKNEASFNVQGSPMLYFAGNLLGVPQDRLASFVNYDGSTFDYFPWGEQKGTSNAQNSFNFATYWQDSLTGLDYAMNRYYSNAYGRFMTPDPYRAGSGGGSGDPRNPQSWNRYAYVQNDPVNWIDPSGQDLIDPTFDGPEGCFIAGDYDASIQCGFDSGFLASGNPGPPNPFQILSVLRSAIGTAAAAWLITNESRASSMTPIPTTLNIVNECWTPTSQAGSLSYTLEVTYQILDQFGNPMSGSELAGTSVSEFFPYQSGNLNLKPGDPWQYGTATGINANGQFTDYLSAGGLPPLNTLMGSAFQEFSASGTVAGVSFYQPLQITGFGAGTYVLSNYYSPTNVTINGRGLGTNPVKECPQ